MTLTLELQIPSDALNEKLQNFAADGLPRFRRRLVKEMLLRVVDRVIARNPVETGRARNAWISAATQLRDGISPRESEGSAMVREEGNQTAMEATNEVDYTVFLEDGTRNIQPRHIVSRSLAEVRVSLPEIVGTLWGEEIERL